MVTLLFDGVIKSILQSANDSWDKAQSSYADSSSYDGSDSSQEECLRVADKHHCDKNGAARAAGAAGEAAI